MDTIIKFFTVEKFTGEERVVAQLYWSLASEICDMAKPSAERTVALRKLLESRDAAFRALMP